jgi:hypothetical protein
MARPRVPGDQVAIAAVLISLDSAATTMRCRAHSASGEQFKSMAVLQWSAVIADENERAEQAFMKRSALPLTGKDL